MSPNFPSNDAASGVAQVLQSTSQTVQNSWDLFKMSWALLWKQTVFPFVTLLVAVGGAVIFSRFVYQLGVIQTIIVNTHRVGTTNSFTTSDIGATQTHNIFVVLGTLVGYLFLMHIFNFFMKVALAASTNAQLTGGSSGFSTGIVALFRHFFTILAWLIVSGVVGFFLGMRNSRSTSNPLESMAVNMTQSFADSAWKIITFLTVPVIVAEKVGPINAIKRSTQLVRDTWGRQLIGRYGVDSIVGSITGAVFVVIVVLGGGLTYFTHSVALGVISALVLISALTCIGALRNALVTIYQTVLYRYANKESIPGYAPNAFQNVFSAK